MRKSGRLVCLTNIPTPYRLSFFARLSDEFARRGWNFEAWFMAHSEPGRHWRFEDKDFRFQCKIFPGLSPYFRGASFHINPGVFLQLLAKPPDILLAGGAWLMPTTILASLAARRAYRVFWSESQFLSTTHADSLTNGIRSFLLRRYHAVAVPGILAREYIQHFAPHKPLVTLPNLVDPTVYGDRVRQLRNQRSALRQRLSLSDRKRVLLISARLLPTKGILPFLNALLSLPGELSGRLTVLLAGEGELRDTIENWIGDHPSPEVVSLGQQTQEQMCKLYALSDGFALPSYSDPNPLSVIEALWAGLPVILSDRVGNHHETLVAHRNGWLFSTDDTASICSSVASWLKLSDSELFKYGESSSTIASSSFDPITAVPVFVDGLITLYDHRK
jgi:glycosyltransferase involved in cell wall biosynthesis